MTLIDAKTGERLDGYVTEALRGMLKARADGQAYAFSVGDLWILATGPKDHNARKVKLASEVRRVERVTVETLLQSLRMLPPHTPVALSRDPEGNGVHYFDQMTVETDSRGQKVVVLWPMHDEVPQ